MKRKILTMTAIAAATALALGASAAGMSKPEYVASKDRIAAEYKTAKAGCESMSANAKDVCVAQAKGGEKVALAELAASYQPTVKARYDLRLARAEADYSVAKEKCDDQSGNAKDVCVKEAQAVHTAAKADAKAQMKTTDAKVAAGKEIAEARKDANAVKRDADYALAREKCDALAGAAKDVCVGSAKANFGKS
jgi:hypothetical protein